ncbi:MAG: lipase [Mogibacterium sp.]|nr:lipase [Mogibacterium sp.]
MKILCFGDSNTFGYDPRSSFGSRYPSDVRWTEQLKGHTVINCGVNGMMVPHDHAVTLEMIRRYGPDMVIVMIGSNDVLEGADAAKTAARMEAYIAAIKETCNKVLLIAPPTLKIGEWVQKEEKIEESRRLAIMYKELAAREGCMFVDAGDWNIDMTYDGVHFSPEGHAEFARKLSELISA